MRRVTEHMPGKKTAKRVAPISYRPPKDREAAFRARVAASGLSINAFITECIFGRTRHRAAEFRMLSRLLAAAEQVDRQLDEFSVCGAGEHVLAIEAARAELAEIRAALITAMGGSP